MGYVYAGYAVTFGVLALYAAHVVRRGRVLRRALRTDRSSQDGSR